MKYYDNMLNERTATQSNTPVKRWINARRGERQKAEYNRIGGNQMTEGLEIIDIDDPASYEIVENESKYFQ